MRVSWTQLKQAALCLASLAMLSAAPVAAQGVETFDPDAAYSGGIDADLTEGGEVVGDAADAAQSAAQDVAREADDPFADAMVTYNEAPSDPAQAGADYGDPTLADGSGVINPDGDPTLAEADSTTYGEDDLIGAAEGVFGKGAEGVAKMIQGLLKDQGQPNGYIVGREAGGALVVGARYGSGTLHHKVEGERKVYWTGPSIGFDAGANAGNTFVLVYNLFDSEDLYKRYPAGEGQAYLIGGLHASYMRRGDVVLIPIRVGAGLRLGVNAGYMRFSKKQRWLPF